jgi:MFS family permease
MEPAPAAAGLRRNRNWRRLWLGQSISAAGDFVFGVTILMWIAGLCDGKAWAPMAASGALLAASVPVLVLGPLGGVCADRWDPRRVMLVADAARAILIAGLLAAPVLRHRLPLGATLALIYALMAAASCFSQFANPAKLSIIARIVPAPDQPAASGQLQAAQGLAQVLSPTFAVLLSVLGIQWALIFDSATFAVSFLYVRALRLPATPRPGAPHPTPTGLGRDFRAGLRFAVGSRSILTLGAGAVVTAVSIGAVNALTVFFVRVNLHAPASWLGIVAAAIGAGMIAGALLAGRAAATAGTVRVYWLSLLGCGLSLLAFSRTRTLPFAIGAAVPLGLSLAMFTSMFTPLLLKLTPQAMIGRVSAVVTSAQVLGGIAGTAGAGLAAGTVMPRFHTVIAGVRLGPYDTIYLLAGLLLCGTAPASASLLRPRPAAAPTGGNAPGRGGPGWCPPSSAPAGAGHHRVALRGLASVREPVHQACVRQRGPPTRSCQAQRNGPGGRDTSRRWRGTCLPGPPPGPPGSRQPPR